MKIRENQTIPPNTEALGKAAIFVAVVRSGSFAGAAAALHIARSTVSQHVRSLEEKLGVRLISRTTRRLQLTEEGELLYAKMNVALGEWEEACVAFDERRDEPIGTLRVTSPSGLTSSLVGPVLAQLVRDFPAVQVELIADDKIRDLIDDRIDLAVRMAPLGDSRLIARLVVDDRLILVAAPSYASGLGDDLAALRDCDWVGHSYVEMRTTSIYGVGQSKPIAVQPRYRAIGSSSEAQLTLLTGGVGVALMPGLLVREMIAKGALVRVFERFEGRSLPVYALYPARGLMPARTRVFLDRLIEAAN